MFVILGGKKLERLGSARIFYESKFRTLFYVLNRMKKSAVKFIYEKNPADPYRSNISFPLNLVHS